MSMVHTRVMYNVQYEFGWAPVELPEKVRAWREQARAQKEAGLLFAPAKARSQDVQEEEGQSSSPEKDQKRWTEEDITVEDVEMTIAVEEMKMK